MRWEEPIAEGEATGAFRRLRCVFLQSSEQHQPTAFTEVHRERRWEEPIAVGGSHPLGVEGDATGVKVANAGST